MQQGNSDLVRDSFISSFQQADDKLVATLSTLAADAYVMSKDASHHPSHITLRKRKLEQELSPLHKTDPIAKLMKIRSCKSQALLPPSTLSAGRNKGRSRRGPEICMHSRRKSQCKECKGSQICLHGRRRHQCKDCKGSQICVHDRRKHQCKDCKGSQICVHNRRKHQCKECRLSRRAHDSSPRLSTPVAKFSVDSISRMKEKGEPIVQVNRCQPLIKADNKECDGGKPRKKQSVRAAASPPSGHHTSMMVQRDHPEQSNNLLLLASVVCKGQHQLGDGS